MRRRGIAVVVIDHNMRFIADLCDRVLVMAQGRELARGKPQEVLRDTAVIASCTLLALILGAATLPRRTA